MALDGKMQETKIENLSVFFFNVALNVNIEFLKIATLEHTFYRIYCPKMKFSIKDFLSKCDQIRSFLFLHQLIEEVLQKRLVSFLCCCCCWILRTKYKGNHLAYMCCVARFGTICTI